MKHLFRTLLICLVALSATCFAMGQAYSPKAGETVMKITVEGRGDIFVKLHVKAAPKTTAHIIKLVKSGFYDGLRFHKVDRNPKPYLAEVGDPASRDQGDARTAGQSDSTSKVSYEESGFKNEEGAVGLAHKVDDRDSGDSQFYMLLGPARFLDGNYTVFGKVVSGMDILQKIAKGDRITSVTILS